MTTLDWKAAVSAIAPTIAGVLGTPLMGAGVALLCKQLLGSASPNQDENEASLTAALSAGMTPDMQAAILKADNDFKAALIAADVRKAEIEADTGKSVLADVADARSHNAQTVGILRIGYFVNTLSYVMIFTVLIGSYFLLTSDKMKGMDPGTLVAVGGIVGAALQFVYSNCTQINSFFFGSSPSARQNAQNAVDSVTATAKTLSKKV